MGWLWAVSDLVPVSSFIAVEVEDSSWSHKPWRNSSMVVWVAWRRFICCLYCQHYTMDVLPGFLWWNLRKCTIPGPWNIKKINPLPPNVPDLEHRICQWTKKGSRTEILDCIPCVIDGQTDRPTNRCYQMYCLPCFAVDKYVKQH